MKAAVHGVLVRRPVQAEKFPVLDIAGRQLHELDDDAVRIPEVDRQTTGSRAGGAAGDAALLARAGLEHPLGHCLDVLHDEGDVPGARPMRRTGHVAAGGRQILDELQVCAVAVQVGYATARPGHPDHGPEPITLAQ